MADFSNWRPVATIPRLRERAKLMKRLREFFAARDILEVDTPVLSQGTVTDPYVIGIPATFKELISQNEKTVYLQTSPEYAMKRLLAANCGSIYQVNKAFRQGELGKHHNPEFTILEWYRVGWDHQALMNEMDEFLQQVALFPAAERLSYAQAFEKTLQLNPHHCSTEELKSCAKKQGIQSNFSDRNAWLDALMVTCIEPQLGQDQPLFLYDFPASQAALAKIRNENPPVASRFEVYFKGVELANGFHELQNAQEQRKRFEADLAYRQTHQLPPVPLDERFLAALEQGIPDCAGVALGIDRLIMLSLGAASVADVLSFTFENA